MVLRGRNTRSIRNTVNPASCSEPKITAGRSTTSHICSRDEGLGLWEEHLNDRAGRGSGFAAPHMKIEFVALAAQGRVQHRGGCSHDMNTASLIGVSDRLDKICLVGRGVEI